LGSFPDAVRVLDFQLLHTALHTEGGFGTWRLQVVDSKGRKFHKTGRGERIRIHRPAVHLVLHMFSRVLKKKSYAFFPTFLNLDKHSQTTLIFDLFCFFAINGLLIR
jgi:hypothetical protein